VTRFNLLLGAATKVAPMRGLRDHARYVTDLCQHLQWCILYRSLRAVEVHSSPIRERRSRNAHWPRAQELGTFSM